MKNNNPIKSNNFNINVYEVQNILINYKCYVKNGNFISDIKNIESIEKIILNDKNLKNIPKGFKYFVNLKELLIRNNDLNKIENLEGCINLKILDLSNNKINDISELNKLTSLFKLDLSYNQIENIKFEDLSTNVNLRILNLSNNKIIRMPDLKNNINLINLFLKNNQIRNIKNLDNCINLEFLDLKNNLIYLIENLDKNIKLKYLHLSNNQISKIENLDNLKKLDVFKIKKNLLVNIKDFNTPNYIKNIKTDFDINSISKEDFVSSKEIKFFLKNYKNLKYWNIDLNKNIDKENFDFILSNILNSKLKEENLIKETEKLKIDRKKEEKIFKRFKKNFKTLKSKNIEESNQTIKNEEINFGF